MTKLSTMKPANPHILTINDGSSSIKFALFEAGDPLRRILEGGSEIATLLQTAVQFHNKHCRPVKTRSRHRVVRGRSIVNGSTNKNDRRFQ